MRKIRLLISHLSLRGAGKGWRNTKVVAVALGMLFLVTVTASSSEPTLDTIHVTASLVDGTTPVLYAQSADPRFGQ